MVTEKQLANLRPFSATHKPPIVRRGPSIVTQLKKIAEQNISYEDPTTKEHVKGKIKKAIALRYIYNALEGETKAIEGIIDRLDGSIKQDTLATFNNIIINVRELSASNS